MNHRTRLDWMFFWCVLFRDSNIPTEKIVLKEPLKHVPGAGWAMQAASYIFLRRKWEDDKSYITDILNYLSEINHKSQVFIFFVNSVCYYFFRLLKYLDTHFPRGNRFLSKFN